MTSDQGCRRKLSYVDFWIISHFWSNGLPIDSLRDDELIRFPINGKRCNPHVG
jgi:hypothetical protein